MTTPDTILTEFTENDIYMGMFNDCMDNYGCGGDGAEWGNNLISNRLIIYDDGLIAKRDAPNPPSHRV